MKERAPTLFDLIGQVVSLAFEAGHVIRLRLVLFAWGGPVARRSGSVR